MASKQENSEENIIKAKLSEIFDEDNLESLFEKIIDNILENFISLLR